MVEETVGSMDGYLLGSMEGLQLECDDGIVVGLVVGEGEGKEEADGSTVVIIDGGALGSMDGYLLGSMEGL
jgi:hypothetical protein